MQLKKIPASQGIAILYGHRVLPEIPVGITPYANTTITCDALEKFLQTHQSWQALSIEDVLNARYDPDRPAFALTFDDGYKDNKTYAMPILEKYNVPVTIFITGGFCFNDQEPCEQNLATRLNQSQAPLFKAYKDKLKRGTYKKRVTLINNIVTRHNLAPISEKTEFLDGPDIHEMAQNSLISFGWHTHTHPLLTRLDPWHAYQELEVTKDMPIKPYFAYPYGGHQWWVRGLVRLCGFKGGFTTKQTYYTPLEKGRSVNMAIPRIALKQDK